MSRRWRAAVAAVAVTLAAGTVSPDDGVALAASTIQPAASVGSRAAPAAPLAPPTTKFAAPTASVADIAPCGPAPPEADALTRRIFPGLSPDPDQSARAQAAFDQMSPKQRVGQLVMVPLIRGGSAAKVAAYVERNAIGGVLLLGNGWSVKQADRAATRLGRVPTPAGAGLFIAADQEGGQVQRLGGKGFADIPSALTQGRWTQKKLLGRSRGWGEELADVGVNLNFAPVADVVPARIQAKGTNAPIGRPKRSFGSDPDKVGAHAAAAVAGLREAGVGSAVKHFPGLGRVKGNTDVTDRGIVDRATSARTANLDAFRIALAACPTMVMMSLATYTKLDRANPAAFSPAVVTGLLREKLGWTGVVASDALDAAAVRGVPAKERAVRFVQAGGDLAVFGSLAAAKSALAGLRQAYRDDDAFRLAADAAVLRVLGAKAALGLL
jgi:beta-N-acetylhexosaminidase